MKKLFFSTIIATILLFSFYACSDDSVSPGEEEQTCDLSLPSAFLQAQADVSYFQDQEIPDEEQYSVYKQVEQTAIQGSSVLSSAGAFSVASGLLTYAQNFGPPPSFEDGSCVWEINIPEEFNDGEALTVNVYATQASGGVEWQIDATGVIFDENVENHRIITGFTSDDESSGEWNLFDPEVENTPALTYSWDIESENILELGFSSLEMGAISYSKNGADNFMSFNIPDQSSDIHWNEETDSGWIEPEGGERHCYVDFENASCD